MLTCVDFSNSWPESLDQKYIHGQTVKSNPQSIKCWIINSGKKFNKK
jgi:hypothetical protein